MLGRAITHWVVGVIAVVIAVVLAKNLGLKLDWRPAWKIAIFVPVLAIANSTVRPVLRMMSMPVTCLTLGLFGVVINALVFWLAGTITGAEMNFVSAMFGSVVVGVVGAILSTVIKEK